MKSCWEKAPICQNLRALARVGDLLLFANVEIYVTSIGNLKKGMCTYMYTVYDTGVPWSKKMRPGHTPFKVD